MKKADMMRLLERGNPFRVAVLISTAVICAPLLSLPNLNAQQTGVKGVPVEVVAMASEYIPRSTTISHPGHSYTNCLGDTSYFADFSDYGGRGPASGTANTNTLCSTTFTPPANTTLSDYRRVNYTIVKGGQASYLLACTQTWKRSPMAIFGGALAGVATGNAATAEGVSEAGGKWSECPAFVVGSKYTLIVRGTSNAQLEATASGKPIKLIYLSSATLSSAPPKSQPPIKAAAANASVAARVNITSSPSGADIYVDGRFYGDTPSDISLPTGQHLVRVTIGGKEWSRTVQITAGEISLHAELSQ